MWLILLMTAGFVLVTYAGYSAVDALWLQKSRVRQRVDELADGPTVQPTPVPLENADKLPTVSRFLSSQGMADRLLLMTMRAGLKLRPSEFVGAVAGLALGLGIVVALLAGNIWAEILAISAGVVVPLLYVKMLSTRRLGAFRKQLPDALSLVGSALHSGYSFPRAMQVVADEMPDPISEEFQRTINELNVGLSVESALDRMVTRVGSYDLELIVAAVTVQQQAGGKLAEVIETIEGTIRDRVRVEGEMAALTADGKLSGIILILLPIVLALAILAREPGFFKPLLQDPMGIWIIIGGVAMQIVGAVIIMRMLVLDY